MQKTADNSNLDSYHGVFWRAMEEQLKEEQSYI